jgi:hypothetical protein
VRAPHQGPLAYGEALRAAVDPAHAAGACTLLERYAQLRYGPPEPATRARDIEAFSRAVARFALPR